MADPAITPDTVRALLEAATPEDWHTDHFGQLIAGHFDRLLSVDGEDKFPRIRRKADGDLIVEVRRIALAYLAVCAERDRLREIADARGLIRREIKAALGAPDDQATMVQIAARVAAERDRLARVLDNPGDYVQTWKPTYNELVGIAHAQTVTVTVPSVVIRDHLRARLEGDRAGGSDV